MSRPRSSLRSVRGPAGRRDRSRPMPSVAEAMVAARELEALSAATASVRPSGSRTGSWPRSPPSRRRGCRGRSLGPCAAGGQSPSCSRSATPGGVATGGGRPVAVRAQALAFVLLVVLATGSLTTVVAVGAPRACSTRVHGPTPTAAPTPPSPLPSPSPTTAPSPCRPRRRLRRRRRAPRRPTRPSQTETAEPTETPETTETDERRRRQQRTRRRRWRVGGGGSGGGGGGGGGNPGPGGGG